MARTKGVSGVAIGMVGTGALLVYSAIKGSSPLVELRSLLTGKRPEPLSKESVSKPLQGGAAIETATYQGKGKVTSRVGLRPHVATEADYIAATWGVEVQGFAIRNIAGTNTLSDHALGLAIDAMVPPGVQGTNIGSAIFTHYTNPPGSNRVKYVIWQHTIWSAIRGPHAYAKNDHMNHVHISFYPILRGA
jgi:hypothetical protein